jgi:hypothetical protein
MSNDDIVRELAESCAIVRLELERKSPRKAARFACDGLRKLGYESGSFWANFTAASEMMSKYQDGVNAVLSQLVDFIDLEGAVLARLGVDTSVSEPILADVYGMVSLTQHVPSDLTAKGLERLRGDVQKAADIICENSHGPVRRAVDWVFSVKGLRILGGATVASANFAMIHAPNVFAPHLTPALMPMQEVLLPASMALGGICMGDEAGKIVKMFMPKSGE